jgi:DNA-binding protein H-NS
MSNVSLEALIAQRETLDAKIREAQSLARTAAITQISKLMREHQLSFDDVKTTHSQRTAGAKVAPKYRDPGTGVTWSGRGLKPKWMVNALAAGKTLDSFLI